MTADTTWDHASAIHPEVDELRARINGSIVSNLCRLLADGREFEHAQAVCRSPLRR